MPETNKEQDSKVTDAQSENIRSGAVGTDLSKARPDSDRSDVGAVNGVQPPTKPRNSCRTDRGKLHRTRHGILARESLDALVQAGEDRRTFRRLERQYRAALRPIGPLGNLFFDRFWSSYLKLVLIGRLETQLVAGKSEAESKSVSLALVPGRLPTLVSQHPDGQPAEAIPLNEELPPDLLRGWIRT
jgi:hypothetical protein